MVASNSIAEALNSASEVLRDAGVPESRKEAALLLVHVLDVDRTFLIGHPENPVDESQLARFRGLVNRRATGEPAQYIIGSQDFYGRRFEVNPDVLIPRPETEWLIEAALRYLTSSSSSFWICDVGTGSGCIAITLLCQSPFIRAIAVDISESALEVAKRNAKAHKVGNRISFVQSDCFDAVRTDVLFDLIVSNPPYVSGKVLPGLQREVRDHEPRVALSPGDDGLEIIRRLISESPAFLRDKGHLLMEIGFDQSEAVRDLINPTVWRLLDILPDLQGIPRIVVLEKVAERAV